MTGFQHNCELLGVSNYFIVLQSLDGVYKPPTPPLSFTTNFVFECNMQVDVNVQTIKARIKEDKEKENHQTGAG